MGSGEAAVVAGSSVPSGTTHGSGGDGGVLEVEELGEAAGVAAGGDAAAAHEEQPEVIQVPVHDCSLTVQSHTWLPFAL